MFFVHPKPEPAPKSKITPKSRVRGLLSWLTAGKWWQTPPRRSELPPWLREDVGLEPEPKPRHWLDQGYHPIYPHVFHRWRE